MTLIMLVVILLIVECGLLLIVKLQRKTFPWLITNEDEIPTLDTNALKKFINSGFDPHLGWVRKPNTEGTENGQKGQITFHIDSSGSRTYQSENAVPVIASFGDSYAFCRQVEDNETWQAQLSQHESVGVLNYGVGNYGVDQALLRYESMNLPESIQVVVMGFVPETICRVQSYWKHYLEFGNTFGFKPRFVLNEDGKLTLVENLIQSASDFDDLESKLPQIRSVDGFYYTKFRSHQFRFPYLLSLLRNPVKHSMTMSAVAIRGMARMLGINTPDIENLPFTLVMKNNLSDAYRLYDDSKSTKLLTAILSRFNDEALRRGHIPIIVVMPQLLDLKININNSKPYQKYFTELSNSLSIIDMTDSFVSCDFKKLYINDQYGGHLSVNGNRLVAEQIADWIKLNQESVLCREGST